MIILNLLTSSSFPLLNIPNLLPILSLQLPSPPSPSNSQPHSLPFHPIIYRSPSLSSEQVNYPYQNSMQKCLHSITYKRFNTPMIISPSIMSRDISLSNRSMKNIPVWEFIHHDERLDPLSIMMVYRLHMMISSSLWKYM